LIRRPHLQRFSRIEDSKLTSVLRQIPATGIPKDLQGILVGWAEYFDAYAMWTNVGGAIRATYGEAGFPVFDDWSSGDPSKYEGTEATFVKYGELTFDRLTVHKIYQLAAALEQARSWTANPLPDAPEHTAAHAARAAGRSDASMKEAGL
jgi:Primase C terminal 2 (PriCT-2)